MQYFIKFFKVSILFFLFPLPALAELTSPDFNYDGFPDVAVGQHDFDRNGKDTGQVIILYGTESGDIVTKEDEDVAHVFHAWIPDVELPQQENAEVGYSLAWGNFDDQPGTELVIGVPGNDEESGAISIVVSRAYCNGLCAEDNGNKLWHRNTNGLEDVAMPGDRFAQSLITGDFNGDGYDDLAVGVPEDDLYITDPATGRVSETAINAGSVHVIYANQDGSGLTTENDIVLTVEKNEYANQADAIFGYALAACDFNGDGYTDLAASAPKYDITSPLQNSTIYEAGLVKIYYGSSQGLSHENSEIVIQETVGQQSKEHDQFGFALSAGNFNNDSNVTAGATKGLCDLAIGSPYDDIQDNEPDEGSIIVIYGASEGLDYSNYFAMYYSYSWTAQAWFGYSLAVADVNDDGITDLVVGMPGSDEIDVNSGAFSYILGSNLGLDINFFNFFDTENFLIQGNGSKFDLTGKTVAGLVVRGPDVAMVGTPGATFTGGGNNPEIIERGSFIEARFSLEQPLPILKEGTALWVHVDGPCIADFQCECNDIGFNQPNDPKLPSDFDRLGTAFTTTREK